MIELLKEIERLKQENEQLKRENFGLKTTVKNLQMSMQKRYNYYDKVEMGKRSKR